MKNVLHGIGHAFGRAWAGVCRRPRLSAIALGAVAAALFLFGTARLVATNVAAITDSWGRGAQMVVYMDEGVGEPRVARIAGVLDGLTAVERVDYVPADRALERLREGLGDDALLEGVEPGMLPASLEVTLAGGVADVADVHPIVERLRGTEGVESVEFVGAWVDRAAALVSAVRYGGWALFFLVGLATIYVVAATARLRLRGRRAEVEVYELAGASGRFVRGPMLLEGVFLGAAGALAAAALLFVAFTATADVVERALGAAFGSVSVSFFGPAEVLVLVAVGAGLGLVGSFFGSSHRALA